MPVATLRNGKRFDVDASSSILNAALGQGLFIEHSCRTGRCGVCKATVLSGETILLQPEESLRAEDRAAGKILTCCRSLQADTVLNIVDLGRLAGKRPRTVPARIAAIETVAPTIRRVSLRFPPSAAVDYLPGQYLDLIACGVRRSYSIANAPRADRTIDLEIRRFDGGVLSAYWFEKAAVGDLLRAELPLGTFFLRDDPVETVIFLATGTGIAPVRAMIEEIASTQDLIGQARILIYWGNRLPEDFYWCPSESAQVHFQPILSRPTPEWAGRIGYVQHAVIADGVDLQTSIVYACGSQAMIDDARSRFSDLGLPDHRFQFDAFVKSASVEPL